jgi:hypothetical protein
MWQTSLLIPLIVGFILDTIVGQNPLFYITLICTSSVARLYYTYSRLTINSWLPALLMWFPWVLAIAYASFLVHKKEVNESLPYWWFFITSFVADGLFEIACIYYYPRTSPITRQKTIDLPQWWVNDTIGTLVPLMGLLIYETVHTFSINQWWIIQASLILTTLIISLAILTLSHHHCGVVMPARCVLWVLAIATNAIPVASLLITHDRSLFASGLLTFTFCIFVSAADLTRRPNEEPEAGDSFSVYPDDESPIIRDDDKKPPHHEPPINWSKLLESKISQPGATAPPLLGVAQNNYGTSIN